MSSKHRRKGYGKQILQDMMKLAKEKGYDTLRLYTSKTRCPEAIPFYNSLMDFGEPYTLEVKELERYVYTKSLIDIPAKKWNNRSLRLDIEEAKEDDGLQKYLNALSSKEV